MNLTRKKTNNYYNLIIVCFSGFFFAIECKIMKVWIIGLIVITTFLLLPRIISEQKLMF